MIKCFGKRPLVFLAKTVDYPERGSESIPKYLSDNVHDIVDSFSVQDIVDKSSLTIE
jgi:hypothetical protein